MDYEKLINKLTNRRDYFRTVDFQQHAQDLDRAIAAIQSLLKEKSELENKLKEMNKEG